MRSLARALAAPMVAVTLLTCAGVGNADPAPAIARAPCPDNPEGECGT